MKISLLPVLMIVALSGCTLSPEQEAWNKAHHVGEINWSGTPGVISTSPGYPYNDKNDADPNPHSDSDDAQRAAYIRHQQDQQREQDNTGPSMPDLSKMTCAGSSNVVTGSNSGMMTSSTNCHN